VAAFLPGDAVTLILETVPLYILYEVSILVASFVARRDAKRERAEAAAVAADGEHPSGGASGAGGVAVDPSPPPAGGGPANELEPDVKQIIDHIDRELS
jgi:hypothetical protein